MSSEWIKIAIISAVLACSGCAILEEEFVYIMDTAVGKPIPPLPTTTTSTTIPPQSTP